MSFNELKKSYKEEMPEKILFITGKLAERQLKRILKSMKPDLVLKLIKLVLTLPL